MVTRVAHEELDFVGEKGRLRSQHGVYCFALRVANSPENNQLSSNRMNSLQDVGVRVLHHPVLEVLNRIRELLRDRIIAVDHGVDQRVGKIINTVLSELPSANPDALAHRVKKTEVTLLESDQEALTNNKADLWNGQIPIVIEQRGSRDNEIMVCIGFRLGALRHVDRVLERNGVKPECGGHSPQFGLIAKSLNIDPGDVVRFHQAGQCCNVVNIDGLNVVGRVLRNADTWLG